MIGQLGLTPLDYRHSVSSPLDTRKEVHRTHLDLALFLVVFDSLWFTPLKEEFI